MRKKMVDTVGDFTVFNYVGRNYLYYKDKEIAQCVNGDYLERFGSIDGWVKHIMKREQKRIDKIQSQIDELNDEMRDRTKIIVGCEEVISFYWEK